jgi:hypothetical protein
VQSAFGYLTVVLAVAAFKLCVVFTRATYSDLAFIARQVTFWSKILDPYTIVTRGRGQTEIGYNKDNLMTSY